jgi:hypothetical protein
MKPWTTAHRTTATSQPQAQSALTGAGSLSASLASRGVVVSRYTWQGTINRLDKTWALRTTRQHLCWSLLAQGLRPQSATFV